MGLLISKNGTIGDYSRPPNRSKNQITASISEKKEEEGSNPHGEQDRSKEKFNSNKSPYQKALNSYREQKSENTRAKSLASLSPITIETNATVQEAIEKMKKYKIHHLLYTDSSKAVCGILSDRDILDKRRSENAYNFATKEVIVAKEFTDIRVICSLMLDKLVSAVPLVNDKGQLTGIITKTDILEYAFRSQHLEIYV